MGLQPRQPISKTKWPKCVTLWTPSWKKIEKCFWKWKRKTSRIVKFRKYPELNNCQLTEVLNRRTLKRPTPSRNSLPIGRMQQNKKTSTCSKKSRARSKLWNWSGESKTMKYPLKSAHSKSHSWALKNQYLWKSRKACRQSLLCSITSLILWLRNLIPSPTWLHSPKRKSRSWWNRKSRSQNKKPSNRWKICLRTCTKKWHCNRKKAYSS